MTEPCIIILKLARNSHLKNINISGIGAGEIEVIENVCTCSVYGKSSYHKP